MTSTLWKFSGDLRADFEALEGLVRRDREALDGAALAAIVERLTSCEVAEGGPYRSVDGSVDRETNEVIARFLRLLDIELAGLEEYVGEGDLRGDPHPGPLPSNPHLASPLRGEELLGEGAETPQPSPCEGLNATGGEHSGPFELFLRLCEERAKRCTAPVRRGGSSATEEVLMRKILAAAEGRFAGLPFDVREDAMASIEKTIRGNPDKQMSLMAQYMKEALGSRGAQIPEEVVIEMGLANIFFWTAFIIYDDFWDEDEAAAPRLLPIANLFARHYVDFFDNVLPAMPEFRTFFHSLMDKLDGANAWETRHCRTRVEGGRFFVPKVLPEYGEYDQKFYPASGHMLGSVALLAGLGYDLQSAEVQHLIEYFKQYLIAMQLNDDGHDWEEDMARGHISTVVDMLLRDLQWEGETIDLVKDKAALQQAFWFKTLPRVVEKTLHHTQLSRRALESMMVIENLEPLAEYFRMSERSVLAAQKEQQRSVEFLQAFEANQK